MKGIIVIGLLLTPWGSDGHLRQDGPVAIQPRQILSLQTQPVNCNKVREDEVMCMACNIYFESRNQSEAGKIAVGAVTVNRVKSEFYPNSVCDVVWQRRQFSWTHDGKKDVVTDSKAWRESLEVAHGFFVSTEKPHGVFEDPTDCALFYHATYIRKPYWVIGDRMVRTQVIEQHAFYQDPDLQCPFEKVKDNKQKLAAVK